MKFQKTRIAADYSYSFLLGRYHRFTNLDERRTDVDDWYVTADFPTNIVNREELGEINNNRVVNMRICCRLLDGLLIKPGGIFSMQHLVGESSSSRGFKDGPVIMKNKMGIASGGGLCQISSALFNVALLANCKILEKHNHSKDFWGDKRFIDLGRDAVYVFGRLDLKFENIHGHDLVLRMNIDEDQLILNCRLLSLQMPDYKVVVESEIVRRIQPGNRIRSKNVHGEFRDGYLIRTRRTLWRDQEYCIVTYNKIEKYKPFVITE